MIRRHFRTLAGWCWAMYLVALIVWIVALVASFVVEMNCESNWGNVNGCTLHEGTFKARLRHRTSQIAPFQIAFPGLQFKAADVTVTWGWGPGGPNYSAVYRDHELSLEAWLITLVLLTPMALGMWRQRRRSATPTNSSIEVVRLLFRFIMGVALWVFVAMGLVVLLTIPHDRIPRVRFDIGTAEWSAAGIFAEMKEGSLNVSAGVFNDRWAEILSTGRTSGAPFPPDLPIEKFSLKAFCALIAIIPFASLVKGLWPVRPPTGCCQHCGYDLRGSPASAPDGVVTCPECGWSGAA